MFKKRSYLFCGLMGCLIVLCSACQTTTGNSGRIQTYSVNTKEADWIRNGEALTFENEQWYPADDIEVLTDSEVYPLGEQQGTQFFAVKTDVRPYNRLYTKFSPNQFRYFLKRKSK